MSRRRRPLTPEEARARMNQSDLDSLRGWKGAQNDLVRFKINCVVCGGGNEALVQRFNMPHIQGAKHLCEGCQEKGWAWMGTLQADVSDGPQGTIVEPGDMSTLEKHAIEGSKRQRNEFDNDAQKDLDNKLFRDQRTMKSRHQNPIHMFKPIRNFEDDVLMLHLRRCKHPSDIDEAASWDLWIDKKKNRRR